MRNDRRVGKYRIHDLWREIIVSKLGEQNIMTLADEQSRAWPEKVRCLSINNHWEYLQQSKHFTRLRSLLMFNATDSLSKLSMLASSNDGLRLLTVLDLRGALLETFPNEVLKLLQLKYLSLRETNVKIIPKSIGKLQNLEILDLKQTYVTKLPDDILKLKRLRHILLYRHIQDHIPPVRFKYQCEFKAPTEIGSLSSLHKLCSIETNHDNGTSLLGEVGKLTQLSKLQIESLKNEDGRVLCSSLEKLSNLRSLITHEGEELCFKAGGFQKLVKLYLRGLKGLRWVKVEAGSMPRLEELVIWQCELVEELPSGIEHLTSLKSLELVDMSDGLISSLNRDLVHGSNWKISYIPKVWIGDTKLGYWKGNYL
ncbi:hypothetical protein ACSBR1_011461 [Camellia fascicularis]